MTRKPKSIHTLNALAFGVSLALAIITGAMAQFSPNEVLTAAKLNATFANHTQTAGSVNGTPIGNTSRSTGAFTSVSINAGTVGLPSLYFANDLNTGWYRIGANNYGFAVNSSKVLDLSSTRVAVTGTLSADTLNVGTFAATTLSFGTLAATAMTLTSPLGPAYGGTGVANNSAATFTRSGNHALTLTTTGTTNVTLPTSGTLSTNPAMAPLTTSLSGDVNLSNTATFFDGPAVTQGSTGTWFASGAVVLDDGTGSGGFAAFECKLWDGTTTIASGIHTIAIGLNTSMSLSGMLASPAGNLRISCKDISSTSGHIKFNNSGLSKDSTITAIRVQ